MATRKRRRRTSRRKSAGMKATLGSLLTLLAVILLAFGAERLGFLPEELLDVLQQSVSSGNTSSMGSSSKLPRPTSGGEFELHMIDVGQALSVFLRAPTGECALIDAGDRDDGEPVTNYLKNEGVQELDLIIATHAHADHIGGMADVVNSIPADTIVMTALPEKMQPTTKVYTDLLKAIRDQGEKITPAKPGNTYSLGEALITIMGPVKDYEDLNNTSVVCRIDYGERSFLVQGDAEEESELDMLDASRVNRADVLIAGHHGSSTSSCQNYLDTVHPMMVGISCGMDNKYGHPHRETIQKLNTMKSKVYRTDLSGTVIFMSNGESLEVTEEKAA